MDKIAYSIIWILLLFFIAWPIAGFCAGFWIFLQPFEACFSFGSFYGSLSHVPYASTFTDDAVSFSLQSRKSTAFSKSKIQRNNNTLSSRLSTHSTHTTTFRSLSIGLLLGREKSVKRSGREVNRFRHQTCKVDDAFIVNISGGCGGNHF